MGAAHGDIENLSAEHVRGADTARNHRGARSVDTGIRALRSAPAELHHAVALRRAHNAGCLGCNETLVVDDVQKRSLNELCLHNRRDDLDERFARENDRALRNRIDIAGEAEVPQVVEEGGLKDAEALQIGDIRLRKVQVLYIVDELVESRADCIAVALGVRAVKHVEDNGLVDILVFKIALHHRELVQVCQ